MTEYRGPEGAAPPPASGSYPPRSPNPAPRVLAGVVAGLAVVLLVIAVIALPQRADDGSAVVDAERDTTTSESPNTTPTSESPGATETDTDLFLDELHLGDCFDDSNYGTSEEFSGEIRRVECGSLHDAEVFALVTLPGEPGASYPGDDEIARLGDELCENEFATYVGIDYLDSMWEYEYYTPTQESWREVDDRLVICYLGDPHFDKLEGSKRDSGT